VRFALRLPAGRFSPINGSKFPDSPQPLPSRDRMLAKAFRSPAATSTFAVATAGSTLLPFRFASQPASAAARSAFQLRRPLTVCPVDWPPQCLKPVAAFLASSICGSSRLHSPWGLLPPAGSKRCLDSSLLGPPSKFARSPFAPPSCLLLNSVPAKDHRSRRRNEAETVILRAHRIP